MNSDESDEEPVIPAAPASRTSAKGPALFMADTGSPNDLIGRDNVPKGARLVKLPDQDQIELSTAGGFVVLDTITEMNCEILREIIEPLVLAESPAVLSIGKRVVHHKYDFIWRHGALPYYPTASGSGSKLSTTYLT